ncbi:cadherin-related family member 5 isoform X3 [Python bivittatus]|uniref:Cadherin-related family member 5 isoform X3 n=1 Tax=Python bivittatus TaxID=176946 RepID=A0A9F5N3I0_PYTBI|nr:cadherin-related family member 5 isoform X3 [Python bivittatus]
MAFLNLFCSFVLFLLVSVMQVQTQSARCSVDKHVVEIKENNQRGLVIANISADPGITVTIEPSTANSHSEWFEIKSSQLILKVSVDFENITALQVQMACWKEHLKVQSLSVLITITGENDNYPEFKETNITVDVSEDTKVNTTVIPLANVTATDADLDVLFYSLEGSPPQAMDYFSIQGINNPQIYLRKDLDYEAINFMEFTLRAMDGRAGTAGIHTATATIYIRIIESDLRPPWFQPCTVIEERIMCISLGYTGKVSLSEDVSGPLILEPGPLHAIDGEKSLNEKVVYKIAAGNDYNTFSINEDSGNITMNKPANTLKPFMLYIVASQENNPYRYSQTTVKIDVVRKNDNQPYFEETIYTGRVSVDQPAKTLIMKANASSEPLQIFAADDDFLPDKINPDIKYRIQNSSDFRVTAEGFIQTTVVLSASSHITLLAIATDTSTLEEASTLISVDVTPLASNSSQLLTTDSPVTGISQATVGSDKTSSSSAQASLQTGTTTGRSVTSGTVQSLTSSQIAITKTPTAGASPAPDDSRQSTTATSLTGITKPSTTGRFVTTNGGTVQSLTSSQTAITKTPIAGASPAPDSGRQSTTATPSTGITKLSTTGLYTVEDMAALGATLGILLAIALALLALMSYKYYKLKKELEKESLRITEGFSNLLYDKVSNLQDGKNSDSGVEDDQSSANLVSMSYAEERESENNQAPAAYETIQEEEIEDLDSEKEVRSILTKDRKMEDDGYKAVWFREDVVPEAKGDVVVIEDDSDLEQNGVDSENDSTADEDDYNNNTDSSRGDSDITDSPKRAQLLSVNPSASQSLEGEEENDAL